MRGLVAVFALIATPAAAQISVAPGRQVIGTSEKPCRAGGYRILDNAGKDASGMLIQGCAITTTYMGINLHNKQTVAKGFTVRDTTITLSTPAPLGTIPVGIHAEWGEDILIERVTASGFRTVPDTSAACLRKISPKCEYPNGDPFGSEFAVRLTYRDTVALDGANGCYDDKAHFVRYENVVGERCDFLFRDWWRGPGNFVATTATARDMRKAVIQLANGGNPADPKFPGDADLTIDHLIVDNKVEVTPILYAEDRTSLTIGRCTIRMPLALGQTQAFGGTKAKRTLGPGCMDVAGNVIIAAPEPTDNFIWLPENLRDGDGDGKIETSAATRKRLGITARNLRPTGETTGTAWRFEVMK